MTVTSTITCDKCGEQIYKDDLYLAAGVYGIDLHLHCVKSMSGDELITMLDLDIKVMKYEGWADAVKAPAFFRKQFNITPSEWLGPKS